MKKLELNQKLVDALIKLREATVEIEEVMSELEKRDGNSYQAEIADFNEYMHSCLATVSVAVGNDVIQSIRELVPQKQ